MVSARSIAPYARFAQRDYRAGRVHSVFRTSFNVELGGRLVHVGGDDGLFSCTGLTVPAADMPGLLAGLRAGDMAVARDGQLRLYSIAGVAAIDLREAGVVPCSLPACVDAEGALWGFARLCGVAQRHLCGLVWDAEACDHLPALVEASLDGEAFARTVAFLIGRGVGLTPAGDDLLLGFATALRMSGAARELPERLARAARRRTTDVSVSYFDALAHGWVSPVYLDLAHAVAARDFAACERAVRAISGIGHTSGWDALAGVRLGFARMCRNSVSSGVPQSERMRERGLMLAAG